MSRKLSMLLFRTSLTLALLISMIFFIPPILRELTVYEAVDSQFFRGVLIKTIYLLIFVSAIVLAMMGKYWATIPIAIMGTMDFVGSATFGILTFGLNKATALLPFFAIPYILPLAIWQVLLRPARDTTECHMH